MSKNVLITGATSGFGYEFVKLFAKDKHRLILVARNEKKLNQIKEKFSECQPIIIAQDLTEETAVDNILRILKKVKVTVDLLINNAGFGLRGAFDQLSIEKQLKMIQLNISAVTELTYKLLPMIKKSRKGKILNVASTAAFQPGPKMAVYYATKAYVLSFSEALHEELKSYNIHVLTLCPGASKTNFVKVADVGGTKMFSGAMLPEKVVEIAYKSLLNKKRVVIPGLYNKVMAYLAKFLPRALAAKVAKYLAD